MDRDKSCYDFKFVDCTMQESKKLKARTSLGEGDTPLRLLNGWGFKNLWVKDEGKNPTGSFKDRESVLSVAKALEEGVKELYIVSSGNAAISVAAYARKAQIKCTAYIPKKTSESKKRLIKQQQVKLVEAEGDYETIYRQVLNLNLKGKNVTAGVDPYRVEGNKAIALEIWEQLGIPDAIVVPCGNGGLLAGIWRGFWELKKMEKINVVPRMIAVQVAGAAPLKLAFELGKKWVKLDKVTDSIAEGIVARESYCAPKAIQALKDSGGGIIEVAEAEIIKAFLKVNAGWGISSEPTAAAAFAAIPKLASCGIQFDDKIVIINTGANKE